MPNLSNLRGRAAATQFRVVFITAPSASAQDLARRIVAEGLAACVNVVPGVASHYVWKGRQEKSRESLLIAKIRAENWKRLSAFVERHHPYEVPEIIAIPVASGSSAYLQWLASNGRGSF